MLYCLYLSFFHFISIVILYDSVVEVDYNQRACSEFKLITSHSISAGDELCIQRWNSSRAAGINADNLVKLISFSMKLIIMVSTFEAMTTHFIIDELVHVISRKI